MVSAKITKKNFPYYVNRPKPKSPRMERQLLQFAFCLKASQKEFTLHRMSLVGISDQFPRLVTRLSLLSWSVRSSVGLSGGWSIDRSVGHSSKPGILAHKDLTPMMIFWHNMTLSV